MGEEHLGPKLVLHLPGGILLTEGVVYTWIIMLIFTLFFYFATRNLNRIPKGIQTVMEILVGGIYRFVEKVMGKELIGFAPYMGTLFLLLVGQNYAGLFGIRPVTADLNTTLALSTITFFLIHFFSIRTKGIVGYIQHLSSPSVLMLPINIITELAFPVSLAFRLFGNITGGLIIVEFLYKALGVFSQKLKLPVPLLEALIPLPVNLFFDVFEGILQAFIFTILTMTFVSMACAKHGHAKE